MPSPTRPKACGDRGAGYGRQLPDSTPTLNLYHDPKKGKWHLAYVVEDVRSRQKSKSEDRNSPLVYDYVVDALSGSLVAELPRTETGKLMKGRLREAAVS